ncbi:TonB-dependent receptor [Phenylobacterium montanum]|uniref:TonB-dependent receptor n=1 Tax=Phenylobacterium montanum TaxID=2823693 RepID=A0A975IVF1_9CAUL|nr:TonB-dependent receptor [Caulobacter sp. S6]QUD88710.1 TonB-dependent receptor [Caulobacter sp. S6]
MAYQGSRTQVRRAGRAAWLAGAAAFTLADAASAQQASSAPQQQVEEVVVTARHREERLQNVPISVAVVNGAAAAAKNLNDIADISQQVPSVDFRTGASNKDRTVFIRGTGTISTSPGVEPSVSTVVDGVVMARPGQATVDLLDLDHIEVLLGPQGTLFGKNASAGVVNIVTRNPSSSPSGYLDAAYYEGDEYRISAAASGPITSDVRALLSVFTGYYAGNVKNLYSNQDVNGYRHDGARLKAIATPLPNLTLTFGADYTHSVDSVPTGVIASTGQVAYCPAYLVAPPAANSCHPNVFTNNAHMAALLASQGIAGGPDNRTVSTNTNSNVRDDNGGVSLQADYDLPGGYRLTSITAWRDWRNTQRQDYDQMSDSLAFTFPAVVDIGHVAFTQTSEELRIASPKGQFVDYVAGLFYLGASDHEIYERDVTHGTAAAPVFDFGVNHYGSSDDNYAVFGEANVNFTKNFRLIAGYREIWDSLSYYTGRVSTAATTGVAASFADRGHETKDGWAGRVGLQYDVSSDVHAYATISRGYKGPAYNVFFNMGVNNTPPLKPETSNSYEVGVKSQLLDRRVQANLSAFLTDFDNYQANSTQVINGALVTNLVNAGSVTTRGFEADIVAKPAQGLTYYFDGAYDDAHVVNFPCPTGAAVTCHINGEPLPFAPRWKLHVEQDYRRQIADQLSLDVDTDYNWQAKTQYQLSQTPDTIQPAYGIWNASVGLIGTSYGGWSARVLVKNILDQHYSSYLSHGDLAGVMRWVPRDDHRYFGIDLHKDF